MIKNGEGKEKDKEKEKDKDKEAMVHPDENIRVFGANLPP